ncbi:MAG: NIPSNAP family protein [Dehalococcoidia bacterium]
MIYEMRTYETMPGKMRTLVERFANVTNGLFLKYGFRPVGYWTESIGENDKFHYMLAWESDEERLAKWAEFRQDPERAKAFAESEKDGPLVARINNRIWVGTAFSAIK